ncbi:MAG: PKD domain-containing protein, partial [Candidatus Bipolaricaulota bacterium]
KTATDSSTIKIEQTPNRSPIPRIEKSESQGPAPLEVTFDASRSRDPDGEISNYKWDFGDGTTESGRKVIHTFQEEGSFVVKLRVTDEEGAVSTTEEEIVVRKSHYEIGEQAENGYIAMQLDSVETSSTIKGWEAETDSKFVILNLQIEALQDNQYPSKTFFLYLEDSSGEQHTVSLATGVIEDFFRSQILESGEQIQGQMAYQVPAEDDGPYYLVYSHPYQADLQFKFSL